MAVNLFGYRFIQFDSNTYVVRYRSGRVAGEGRGLAFWYFAPTTSIAAIPLGSREVQFIFKEVTGDFQTVTIQGTATYKVDQPKQLADQLDFSVNYAGAYKKEDPEQLPQRLINEAQTATSAFIRSLTLKDAIRSAKTIETTIFEGLQTSSPIRQLGLVPVGVNILAVRPTPEMEKALEAATREALQVEADDAIYKRRNFAVEKEREVKENELNTEIAVAEKQRQIRETELNTLLAVEAKNRELREQEIVTQLAIEAKNKELTAKRMETRVLEAEQEGTLKKMKMEGDTLLEQQRKALVDSQLENDRKRTEAQAFALKQMLTQYEGLDWRTILALNGGGGAGLNIALAFRELAERAEKIGHLNITPDLLNQLIQNDPPIARQNIAQTNR